MILKTVATVLMLGIIGAAASYWFVCPCETIPGGPLSGEQVTKPVQDWSFVNDIEAVPLCQIQVDFLIPRSMNVNCMSTGGELFVSCSRCADKQWAARALEHPEGFVRASGRVYAISYQRVTDEQQLDEVWSARLAKIRREPSTRPDHWWSFNLSMAPASNADGSSSSR